MINYVWYRSEGEQGFLSCLSMAMERQHNQDNSQKKGFIGSTVSESESMAIMAGRMSTVRQAWCYRAS